MKLCTFTSIEMDHNGVLAGHILDFVQKRDRAVSVQELLYYFQEQMIVKKGIEKLIEEELAVLEIEHDVVKLVIMPDFDEEIAFKKEMMKQQLIRH